MAEYYSATLYKFLQHLNPVPNLDFKQYGTLIVESVREAYLALSC